MKLRAIAYASALAMVVAISGCGSNVAAGGSAHLAGAQTTPTATAKPNPTPKPTVTVAVSASPTGPSPTPSASPTTGGPVIPLPILTRIPIPSPADCITYNPATVTYVDLGADGFQITDGSNAMLVVDNISDALTALSLVRNYDKQCFVGRDNPYTGEDHYRYIVDYWSGTGLSGATVPTPDCVGYDNTSVAINNLGSQGYQIVAGSEALAVAATLSDANAVKSLAASHHNLCFIGRSNTRSDRTEYIVEYWT